MLERCVDVLPIRYAVHVHDAMLLQRSNVSPTLVKGEPKRTRVFWSSLQIQIEGRENTAVSAVILSPAVCIVTDVMNMFRMWGKSVK